MQVSHSVLPHVGGDAFGQKMFVWRHVGQPAAAHSPPEYLPHGYIKSVGRFAEVLGNNEAFFGFPYYAALKAPAASGVPPCTDGG